MENKEKLMIYPFDIQSSPLLRHREYLGNYEIRRIVSPNGWGLSGRDAGTIDGGDMSEEIIDKQFDELLDEIDAVMFVEPNGMYDFNTLIYPKIVKVISKSRNIICTIKLDEEMREEISCLCKKNNIYFKYYNSSGKTMNFVDIKIPVEGILVLKTPVVLIAGITERTHKFDIQLSLREKLTDIGYKISQIGTRDYCELFGFHSFPDFMFSNKITESSKVVLFNHFIKAIETKENPDLFIIGIPGGIMPINNTFTNRFGLTAYMISQAVVPDIFILSLLYEDYDIESLNSIIKAVKGRMGFDIDCINISSTRFDWSAAKQTNLMSFISLDYRIVDNKKDSLKSLSIPVYNILNKKDTYSMADYIIDILANVNDIECI
jgi:peptide maturation system protein (TIGR04066 family)